MMAVANGLLVLQEIASKELDACSSIYACLAVAILQEDCVKFKLHSLRIQNLRGKLLIYMKLCSQGGQ